MKLFISLRKTVEGVATGSFTEEDLRTGLFYFYCSRNVVLKPHWASAWEPEAAIQARAGEPHAAAHAAVVEAALAAEADGRAVWFVPGKPMTFDNVNVMLRRVGLREIAGYDGRAKHGLCNGDGIKARAEERNLPLEVIY